MFDSNVLISALLRSASKPGQALVRATRDWEILVSEVTLVELRDVLNRARFRRYVDYETVRLFLESLTSKGALGRCPKVGIL